MKELITRFMFRWAANTAGLWVASQLITSVKYGDDIWFLVVAGLILSVINVLIKPLLVLVSLPFIVLSLGLFIVVINGVLVWLVSVFYGPFIVDGFTSAVLAGLIIGLVNYISTIILDRK